MRDSASNMVSMKISLKDEGIIRDALPCVKHEVQGAVKDTTQRLALDEIKVKWPSSSTSGQCINYRLHSYNPHPGVYFTNLPTFLPLSPDKNDIILNFYHSNHGNLEINIFFVFSISNQINCKKA